MNGVTILNLYEEYVAGPGLNGGIVFFGLIGLILLIIGIALLTKGEEGCGPCLFFAAVILFIIFGSYPTGNSQYTSYTKYDVVIDETVSFVEFNKRYEILEQNGLIYTVRERIE